MFEEWLNKNLEKHKNQFFTDKIERAFSLVYETVSVALFSPIFLRVLFLTDIEV